MNYRDKRVAYRQYREYGHGPLTAFSLSCSPFFWWMYAMIIGFAGGLLLWP